jgi:hypothetical protein
MPAATKPRPRGNISLQPLRWSIEAVSREFKLAANTARKILHQGGVEPDGVGTYSTEQVVSCLFGNLHAEKIRKERELVRKYRIENETSEANLLDRTELMKGFAALADAIVFRITSSELSREAKEDLLRDLSTIPVVISNVARRQTRLPRGNGTRPESEGEER